MFFYSNEVQVRKFQDEKLANVWKPHLESLPLNWYMSQNKTFTRKPSYTWKLYCTKSEIWLETCNIGKKLSLTHLKLEAFKNLKNLSYTHFKLHHWNSQQLEELSSTHFSNFNVETFNNLKNSLSHTLNLKL